MTDHLPPADARGIAFIGAWDALSAAQKLKLDAEGCLVEPLPEIYWATLAEAQILADLARADQTTGLMAGGHLTLRDDRIRENRNRFAEAFAKAQAANDPISDAADDAEHQDSDEICPSQSASGRKCMRVNGHLTTHTDVSGWTWQHDGDRGHDPTDHHCEYDDPARCAWPGHRR